MAIAGLHNVSVLESSYLGENYSPVSRRWANQERPTTRTSSIRRMWRALEGENGFEENTRHQTVGILNDNLESLCSSETGGDESEDASTDANEVENECPQAQTGLQNGQEDGNASCFQRSPAIGIAEKERVRQIFREWGSKSFGGYTSHMPLMNNCPSRAQWLDENESKRGRIVREWIESSSQQGDTSCSEQATEISSQIERVRDGLGANHCLVGARRSIRRLYGRQALLDLLTKFERERKRELQGLLENRLVSNFAHRNRIQSLLRGRFLLNQRFVQDEKPTSVAASELGLLRQTHAVSDIRKGFLSRLNNCENTSDSAHSETSSEIGMKFHSNEQAEENFQELQDEIVNEYETTNLGSGLGGFHKDDWNAHTSGSQQDFAGSEGERHEQVLEDGEREKLRHNIELIATTSEVQEDSVERSHGVCRTELSQETKSTEHREQGFLPEVDEIMLSQQDFAGFEGEMYERILEDEERETLHPIIELIATTSQFQEDSVERNHGVCHPELSQETSHAECREQGLLPEVDEIMLSHPHFDEDEVQELFVHLGSVEVGADSLSHQDASARLEEWQEPATENDGRWHHLTSIDSDEVIDLNSNENVHGWQSWHQETAGSAMQESHEEWYENVPEETTETLFRGNSYVEAAPVGRTDTFYSSDNDNSNRPELRELTSRRRVSNLLQSDFRVRLDQLVQSYVERQEQALESDDEWMPDREQQDQEQQSVDDNVDDHEAVEGTEGAYPSLPAIPQTHWEDDMQDVAVWQVHDINQHLGTEWEIINGLRIDMAKLQERMNEMQKMLETCMDMQLALQRAMQQEVSSALNRSSISGRDEAKWSPGKEEGCFLCYNSSFDSAPNRSGHVYICSNCAEKINWSKLKETVLHP